MTFVTFVTFVTFEQVLHYGRSIPAHAGVRVITVCPGCVLVCLFVCVCVCVRARVHACVYVCVRPRACVHSLALVRHSQPPGFAETPMVTAQHQAVVEHMKSMQVNL